jgi:hypothetical protein
MYGAFRPVMVRLDRTISQTTMYMMLGRMVRSSRTMTGEANERHSFRRLVQPVGRATFSGDRGLAITHVTQ